jgi:hypothetical protein
VTVSCAQCGTRTGELTASIHGPLCPQCSYRQADHDEPGYGLAPSTYGFLDETE